ncbi:hypothetical protein [uncultured Massilia sp.]|uniref:hypothetical protein n=1 Tax=uncultured Massilia sp. TaxID=169973 RepID=UPI002587D3D3|nr:hypothetical protein [uncultured Massilia sp.]
MNNTVRFLLLGTRLSVGAFALALGLMTLVALGVPDFARALAGQGMPTPLTWPAALVECVIALVAIFLPVPASHRVVLREQTSGAGYVV